MGLIKKFIVWALPPALLRPRFGGQVNGLSLQPHSSFAIFVSMRALPLVASSANKYFANAFVRASLPAVAKAITRQAGVLSLARQLRL